MREREEEEGERERESKKRENEDNSHAKQKRALDSLYSPPPHTCPPGNTSVPILAFTFSSLSSCSDSVTLREREREEKH